jgi:hypothetical protein
VTAFVFCAAQQILFIHEMSSGAASPPPPSSSVPSPPPRANTPPLSASTDAVEALLASYGPVFQSLSTWMPPPVQRLITAYAVNRLTAGRLELAGPSAMPMRLLACDGTLFVSDAHFDRVFVYALDCDGRSRGAYGSFGAEANQLRRPHGMALVDGRVLAVADRDNDRVVCVDARAWRADQWKPIGEPIGGRTRGRSTLLKAPSEVAAADGLLFVLCPNDNSVRIFAAAVTTKPVAKPSASSTTTADAKVFTAAAADRKASDIVHNSNNNSSSSAAGTGDGELSIELFALSSIAGGAGGVVRFPTALAVCPPLQSGALTRLWVRDAGPDNGGRIQLMNADGTGARAIGRVPVHFSSAMTYAHGHVLALDGPQCRVVAWPVAEGAAAAASADEQGAGARVIAAQAGWKRLSGLCVWDRFLIVSECDPEAGGAVHILDGGSDPSVLGAMKAAGAFSSVLN